MFEPLQYTVPEITCDVPGLHISYAALSEDFLDDNFTMTTNRRKKVEMALHYVFAPWWPLGLRKLKVELQPVLPSIPWTGCISLPVQRRRNPAVFFRESASWRCTRAFGETKRSMVVY